MTAATARKVGRGLLCAVAVAAVLVFLRRMPVAAMLAALHGADPIPFALAVLVYLTANTAAKVQRWAVLLGPVQRSGPAADGVELARILFASQATSNLLPARAGEAVRFVELRRRGYAVPGLLAAQLVEKVVEAASLCLLCGVAAAAAAMPPVLRVPVWSVALLGLALVGFLALLRSRPAVWPRSLVWSCACDLADAAVLGLCLQAAGVQLGPAAWLLVLLAINLAILVPSTPGHLGVVEAAAGAALIGLGVPPERALAGAVLYHAVQIVPSTALGLAFLRNRWARQRRAA